MNKSLRILQGVVAGLLAWAGQSLAAGAVESYKAEASISFAGTSTLHDFQGQVASKAFSIRISPAPGGGELCTADVEVAVEAMDTGDEDRDENMREMFEVQENPLIHGSVKDVRVEMDQPKDVELNLRIRDKEEKLPARISGWKKSDTELVFDLSFDVSLEKFGLEAPSFLVLISVDDRVRVTCHVKASPETQQGTLPAERPATEGVQ